jgi:hypothetical protein
MSRRPLTVVALALALATTGCSTAVSGSPGDTQGQAGTTDANTAWADKFCGALLNLSTASKQAPPDLSSGDLAKVKTGLSEFLSAMSTGISKTVGELKNIGASPIKGGDDVAKAAITGFDAMKKSYDDAKAQLNQLNPSNTAAFSEGLSKVTQTMSGAAGAANPMKELGDNPELSKAGESAPNCKKLSG